MASSRDRAQQRFEQLFNSAYGDLLAYAVRRTRTRDEAEDVVAEVFAVAWRRCDDMPAGDNACLWLFGIARLVVRSHHRTHGRVARLVAKLASQPQAPTGPRPGADGDPTVRAAFRSLSRADRDVLALQLWEGLSAREIAAVLDVSEAAVWKRLERARTRLRQRLADRGHALATDRDRASLDGAQDPAPHSGDTSSASGPPSIHTPRGEHA